MEYKIGDIVGFQDVRTLFRVVELPTKDSQYYTIQNLVYKHYLAVRPHEIKSGKTILNTRIKEAKLTIDYCKAQLKEYFPRKTKGKAA